ncbi:MAG: hypothetical protein ILA02_06295 [Clostridia bacterium]|nr:hypothetical protein [Clostridia bacterium]
MKNKKSVKTGFEKCLNEFDEIYSKNYNDKQKVMPILLNLYNQYKEEIFTLTTLDKEIHKLQLEISNKIEKKCNKKQKELIYQLKYCISSETGELVEKAFVYGFCVAQSLKDEADTFINNKDKNYIS